MSKQTLIGMFVLVIPMLIAVSHAVLYLVLPTFQGKYGLWFMMILTYGPSVLVAMAVVLYFALSGEPIQVPQEIKWYLYLVPGISIVLVTAGMLLLYRYGVKPFEVSMAIVLVPVFVPLASYLFFREWEVPDNKFVIVGVITICLGVALYAYGHLNPPSNKPQATERVEQCKADKNMEMEEVAVTTR